MKKSHRQKRSQWALAVVSSIGALLCRCPAALALDPSLDVSQYAHTSWKVRDGFFSGEVHAIAQTPDGYLWLGTEYGLFRFDGIRNVPWTPPPDQAMPSSSVFSLLAGRDGALWIGTDRGLVSWNHGTLTRYAELEGKFVISLLEERDGTVWASGAAFEPTAVLCAIHGAVHCYGQDGSLGYGLLELFEDRKGALWGGAQNGLWRWKPGPPTFYQIAAGPYGIHGLNEDDDGVLLIALRDRIARFRGEKLELLERYPDSLKVDAARLARDRDGGLWVGGLGGGLMHVGHGRIDVFSQADGLSADSVLALLEDREGTMWVATGNGLDRFRAYTATTVAARQGLPIDASSRTVAATRDGSIWVGTGDGLRRYKNGQISIYGKGIARRQHLADTALSREKQQETRGSGLPDHELVEVFPGGQDRIVVATFHGLGYLENDRLVPIPGVPAGYVRSAAMAASKDLWIASDRGLFHVSAGGVREISWADLGHKDAAWALAEDSSRGGLWLGFRRGGIGYLQDGKLRTSYAASDGLGEGTVGGFHFDTDGAVWAATEGGLSRVKDGRVQTLTSRAGLPCNLIHWVTEDDAKDFWMFTACGLVRIAHADLNAWVAGSKRTVSPLVLGGLDGVRSGALYVLGAGFAKSPDGKLWFTVSDGIAVVDPHHLPFNNLPPPVHIEQIIADGKTYSAEDGLRIPPLVRDVAIDYTALSLAVPERMRFRFKLEGQDQDWREVVNDRRVEYSNLAPGNYRFRVTASNNTGVWNEQGDVLDFSVPPAYWQTLWFRAACLAALLALVCLAYWLRLRQLARQFNMTLEARVAERTRIARDLHDTLLQSFQGLLLRFQTAYELLPTRATEAKQSLEVAIDRAAQAITEGRDAVQGLRTPAIETDDLALAIETVGRELASDHVGGDSVALTVVMEGAPRTLHPVLRDEIYGIACEALRNAFRHAQSKRIEVELRYGERQLRLRVRDDGKGIDPKFLSAQGHEGHFGLHGMRERAKLMGGKLTVWSALDSGTEVEVSLPASGAYATGDSAPRSWFAERFSTKSTGTEA